MNKKAVLLTLMLALCGQMAFAQSRKISGVVKEAETGNTLPGVAVIEKGTRNGTSTDFDGKFQLTVSQPNATLVFQAIGKEKKEVILGDEDFITVQLKESTSQLEEVVVTALGVQKEKRSLGYSATDISSDEVAKTGEPSPLNALQGKVPGVDISSASGSPGASTRIIIRGAQSISQNNQPLFVVDGVPIYNSTSGSKDLNGGFDFGNGINSINPEDIENISILKGASATALYGSRAANGVVLITTKKGKASKGGKGFGISYAGKVTFSNPLRLPTFQNEFGQGWDGTFRFDENGSWGPKFTGEERPWGRVVDNSQQLKKFEALPTNVKDFFVTGHAYENSVSFSQAGQDGSFYASFSNNTSDGILPTDVDSYKRNTVAVRATRNAGIFHFSGNFNFSEINSSFAQTGQGYSVINDLMQIPRDFSIVDMKDYTSKFYNIDNYYTHYGIINPYFTVNEFGSEFRNDKFFGGLETNVDITKWGNLLYRFGFDIGSRHFKTWEPQVIPSPTSENAGFINDTGSVAENFFNERQFNQDLIFNMDFDLTTDLHLNALVGANLNERSFTSVDQVANNLTIPGFYDLTNTPNPISTTPDDMTRRYAGIYAQTNFSFRNYLFLNLSVRNDWSSTLPQENNSYFYYGANASWVFSDMLNLSSKAFNYGKIRMGYGTTGNDAGPYLIYETFTQKTVDNVFVPYEFPVNGVNSFTLNNRLGNVNLQPEITAEFEAGTELRFFGRWTVDFTYYNRVTQNMILIVPISPESGFSSQTKNVGEIVNQGIEISTSVDILKSDDLGGFTWTLSGNFTKNDNELRNISEGLDEISLGGLSTIGYFAIPGQPLGVFKGKVPKTSPDGKIVVDEFGIPVATTEDVIYGNSQTDFTMGLSNHFGYKGFALDVVFDWRHGGLMYSRTADINFFTGNSIKTTYNDRRPFVVPNSVHEVLDADGNVTGYTENVTPITQENMDDYFSAEALERQDVIDKSYIKLREVALGYSLPSKLVNKTPFTSISVSVFGRNLFLWTPVDNQFIDPEVTTFGNDLEAGYGEFSANPTVRSYGFGLKASF